jgi:hypothetical protein
MRTPTCMPPGPLIHKIYSSIGVNWRVYVLEKDKLSEYYKASKVQRTDYQTIS